MEKDVFNGEDLLIKYAGKSPAGFYLTTEAKVLAEQLSLIEEHYFKAINFDEFEGKTSSFSFFVFSFFVFGTFAFGTFWGSLKSCSEQGCQETCFLSFFVFRLLPKNEKTRRGVCLKSI